MTIVAPPPGSVSLNAVFLPIVLMLPPIANPMRSLTRSYMPSNGIPLLHAQTDQQAHPVLHCRIPSTRSVVSRDETFRVLHEPGKPPVLVLGSLADVCKIHVKMSRCLGNAEVFVDLAGSRAISVVQAVDIHG